MHDYENSSENLDSSSSNTASEDHYDNAIDFLEKNIDITTRQIEQLSRAYLDGCKKQLGTMEYTERMYTRRFLPTQERFLAGLRDPDYFIVGFFAPNQAGKSYVHCYYLIAKSWGFYPHNGEKLQSSDYDLALLLRDYDNHAQKFLIQNVLKLVPPECVSVTRTQKGAPRIIQVTDPVTGDKGKRIHIFTHDQDYDRQEGGTWDALGVDEPCPETAFIALLRGLQQTDGKCSMSMTPLSEPWIYDKLYKESFLNGGPNKTYLMLTAFPDENLESQGGFLKDRRVEQFRELIPENQKEARIYGRFTHLLGTVYPEFSKERHTAPHSQIQGILDEHRDPAGNILLPSYCVIDPHKSIRLPWAIIWAYQTPQNRLVIWDEFPHEDFHKISAKHFLYDFYANEIFSRPHPQFRIMDPNAGRYRDLDKGLTIAEQLARRSRPGRPLGFTTDVNDDLGEGHQIVHEFLEGDKILISQDCRNLILQMQYYTWDEFKGRMAEGKAPKPKPKEKYKHFPDTLRYLCMTVVNYNALQQENARMHLQGDPLNRTSHRRRVADPRSARYREELIEELCPSKTYLSKKRGYSGNI